MFRDGLTRGRSLHYIIRKVAALVGAVIIPMTMTAESLKSKPTFVFLHQPLIDTVSGSLYSKDPKIQYWYGVSDAAERIREILKDHPNSILFTGHTHWTFESLQPVLWGKGSDVNFVNCAAVGYLWNDNDESEGGSEGYFVYVCDDKIILRGREFTENKWCGGAQFCLPLYN